MPDFKSRLAAVPRHSLLIAAVVFAALVFVVTMASAFVAASQEISRPSTPAEAAFAACKTTEKENRFSVTTTTAFKQPDVGRPHGIVVVPRCSMNIALPEDDPSYYSKDVDVYILVSQQQLKRLDVALGKPPKANFPYGVTDDTLGSLMTDKQRATVETDLTHVGVSYYVIAAPLPTRALTVDHGYEYTTAPFDMLSGVRYAHLPFTQQDVYDAGPPIVVGGK